MPRRGGAKEPWPLELRERALELAADVGPSKAADMLDLSVDTVKSWQKRRSAATHKELSRRGIALPVRRNASWVSRRADLLLALGELAEESVAAARLAVSEGRSKAASEFSNVAARALDKAQLLGGDPTSRSESRSLSLHSHAGLAQVQAEGRATVRAREAQSSEGDGGG